MSVSDKVIIENPEVLQPKKYEFKVAFGSYIEPSVVRDEKGEPVLVPVLGPTNRPEIRDGKPVMKIQTVDVIYGRQRPAGDIVKTDTDLRQHNGVMYRNEQNQIVRRPHGQDKFILLDKDHSPVQHQLGQEQRRAAKLQEDRKKLLAKLTRQQLQEYAESEGINLNGAQKQEAILAAIDRHFATI